MAITNVTMREHPFVADMYQDDFFPNVCVDQVKIVLQALCESIEKEKPADLAALYRLTHAATEQINELEDLFGEHDSELETGAREAMAADFTIIAAAYGFDADVEELIAPRDW